MAVLRDPAGILPLPLPSSADLLGVVLDDDDREGREAPVRERRADFRAGLLRLTGKEGEDAAAVHAAAAMAERILVFAYGDTRAWKGRPGLSPALEAVLGTLGERHPGKTLLVAFGSPSLAAAAPGLGAVCAWDDAPLLQRGALDLLLAGRTPTARPPFGASG